MGHIHHNVSALVPLGRVVSMGDYAIDRDLAKQVTAQEAAEAYKNAVESVAAALVKHQQARLSYDDLVVGAHSATQQRDGATLRAAWLAGDAEYGAACRAITLRSWAEDADARAQELVANAVEMLGYD